MIELRKIGETAKTITLGWDQFPDALGFRFSREKGTGYSVTWDGNRTSARFSKDSAWYMVEALAYCNGGLYPVPA